MAKCGRAPVAVASQFGFQLGYPGHPREPHCSHPARQRRLECEPGPVLAGAAPKQAGCKKIK